MRYFENIQMAHSEITRDLAEMGIRYVSATVQDKVSGEDTVELMNYGFTITKPDLAQAQDYAFAQGVRRSWLLQEIQDRLFTNDNPGIAWTENQEFWAPFLRDGRFSYTYGERMSSQIDHVVHELQTRPNTRQAIITVYDQHQDLYNWGGRDRIPCSMHYQFMNRRGSLHLLYVMRSCDLVKFFLADHVMAVALLKHIAEQVELEIGSITQVFGSLHAFRSDLGGVF